MKLGKTAWLLGLASMLCLVTGTAFARPDDAAVVTARAFHVGERTRVVLETSRPVNYKAFPLKNPNRLVLDLQNVELDETLKELSAKVRADDPFIRQVRTGNFKPRVTRVVFDLKGEAGYSLFTLVPVGQYQDRLVLDVYAANAKPSPILEKTAAKAESPAPVAVESAPVLAEQPQEPATEQSADDERIVKRVTAEAAEENVAPVSPMPEEQPAQNTPDTPEELPAGTIIKTPTTEAEPELAPAVAVASAGAAERNAGFPGAGWLIKILIACGLLLMIV